MLPPLTAAVDNFVVSGVVEPRHDLNGDAFDYALSDTTAPLIVLDAGAVPRRTMSSVSRREVRRSRHIRCRRR
jgi:hypothetical protein